MAELIHGFTGLPMTNRRIDGLMADFSGLKKLDSVVSKVLNRLMLEDRVQSRVGLVNKGTYDVRSFDAWFCDVVRIELGKTLGIIRNKAIAKARAAGAGSAATAVFRRTYRDRYAGNINICSTSKRISSRERIVEPPDGGKSGIRRVRTVKARTEQIRKYYGPDRGFILRILNDGRDSFMATPEGPTGRRSQATWGKRGMIAGAGWFHSLRSDMEEAANELGTTLINHVEKWVDTNFSES